MKIGRMALAGFAFLALLPVLAWLPTLVASAGGIASAAAHQGYSNPVAYRALLVWSAIVLIGGALSARTLDAGEWTGASEGDRPSSSTPRLGWEPWLIGLLLLLAYFPAALARTGPFGEDSLMLAVLARMHEGQIPYRDFEFLYGPLLIFPAHWWHQVAGFSMGAYYLGYAFLQALGFAALMACIIRLVGREHRRHWWCFLLIAPFFLDTLLGINWFGLRRLLPLLLLVFVARRSGGPKRSVLAGAAGGLLLAYSHDYAIAALLAIAALALLESLHERSLLPLRRGAAVGTTALATWSLVTFGLLGKDGAAAYLSQSRELVTRFSLGEAGFTFYWTVSAVALFGLFTMSLVRVAVALPRLRARTLEHGDRLLVLGLVYALILLKAGLNRADTFHLTPPFLGLVLATILLPPSGLFRFGVGERRVAGLLVATAALTTLVANLPAGSHLLQGLVDGARGVLTGSPTGPQPPIASRWPALLNDQQHPDSALVALARHLALPASADVPVYFYGSTYGLPPLLGVSKRHFINDDFMYSVDRGLAERGYLEAHPTAIVVISRGQWGRLQGDGTSPAAEYAGFLRPSLTKRLIAILSSVHYRGVPDELALREARWGETVGSYVVAHYRLHAQFGNVVVLHPLQAPVMAPATP
ncbi:MAG: hypothetical protein IPP90_12920 [Gemmatimonadaceae bacterium]|nr:hypothetical protein [Gemmatimonadaceae bacterium]